MDNNKTIRPQSDFAKKLDNFWYHYKWHTLIALVVIIVLVVCLVQCFGAEKYDGNVAYCGGGNLQAFAKDGLCEALGEYLPGDFNNDGKKNVNLLSYHHYTDPEIEELKKETPPEEPFVFDYATNHQNRVEFFDVLQTGQVNVVFLSRAVFEDIKKSRVCPLEDALAIVPVNALDEYGILLSETAFFHTLKEKWFVKCDTEEETEKQNAWIDRFGEDTVLCLTYKLVTTDEKTFGFAKDTFSRLVWGNS